MDKIKNYEVVFSGLKNGKHTFEYEIDQEFFDLFEFDQEFTQPQIDVQLLLDKHSTFLELSLEVNGKVNLICDITTREFTQPIQGNLELLVKFGAIYDDSDDEVWVIPYAEDRINVAQLIYELVLLSIPNKHIHPDMDSEEAQEAMELLDKYAPGEHEVNEAEEEDRTDPRWDSLKDLLN